MLNKRFFTMKYILFIQFIRAESIHLQIKETLLIANVGAYVFFAAFKKQNASVYTTLYNNLPVSTTSIKKFNSSTKKLPI